MLEDEHKLVERAKGGEPEAFGLLYDHYLPKIYRFILLKVGRREEAEDLTHQTFLRAWEHIEQYRSRGYPFSSWLYRIARNAVIDQYRKKLPDVSIDSLPPDLFVEKQQLGEIVELKMEWETILKAMNSLGGIEQDVLIMRFVDDLTHKEVAKAIGKSEGAVKVIQHRAIKNLKNIINND